MQTIKRQSKNEHFIFDMIDSAYELLSDKQSPALIKPVFDKSFIPLFNIFKTYSDIEYDVDFEDLEFEPIRVENNTKNIVLSFSGGKDSVASAVKYIQEGYNVHLYHMCHINPSLSDEASAAKKCADLLGLPIFFDDMSLRGHHFYMEHPMKNMLIANGALSYAIRNGLGTTIGFANYSTSYLEDNPFEKCGGDCMDMWAIYENIISRVIPGFKVMINLEHVGETLDIITKHKQLLDNSISCLCRHSLRPYRNAWVKSKFGVQLGKLRCGSCYKCCIEYVYLADHDQIEFSPEYYKYCFEKLYKVLIADGGYVFNIHLLWDAFFFYPITESKMYDSLLNALLRIGGIKWLE